MSNLGLSKRGPAQVGKIKKDKKKHGENNVPKKGMSVESWVMLVFRYPEIINSIAKRITCFKWI